MLPLDILRNLQRVTSEFSALPKFKPVLDRAWRKWYHTRRFPQMGVIRFRRDTWRSDCAPRMSVGLVNHPAKQ